MPDSKFTYENLKEFEGQEVGVSSWITVDQKMIDQFAETTGDRQWIHIDVERARRESPFKETVAHGYLTLALIPVMSYEIGAIPAGTSAAFNYGIDKVRFVTPVRAGARVRMRTTLVSFEGKLPGQYIMKCSNTIEVEGEKKPALVAETLAMLARERPAG